MLYLIDLLQDKNKEVRRVADQSLDIIMDADDQWATRIRSLKFESYNQEWLEAVARGGQAQQQQQQYQQQAAAQARRQQGDGRAHGAAYDGDEWESGACWQCMQRRGCKTGMSQLGLPFQLSCRLHDL